MTRLFVLLLSLTVLLSFSVCLAETTEPDNILFRGIEWLEPESNVEPAVSAIDGIKPSSYRHLEEGARIDGWYRQWENMYADDNLENGGVMIRYQNAAVAGYNADLTLSFMYPIESGKINYNTASAQFYKAQYSITDIEDYESAYADIVNKLSQLYGNPQNKSFFNSIADRNSPEGSVWTAADGSVVWAAMFYNTYSKKTDTLWITYAAANTEDMFAALEAQMLKEASDAEAIARDENANNFDGL